MSSRTTKPTGVVMSTHQAASAQVIVKSNSHGVQVDADGALWDTTSNAFVKPEDTNLNAPK